jgi:hypothetical protein
VSDPTIASYYAIFGETEIGGNQAYPSLKPKITVVAYKYPAGILSSVLKYVK